VNDNTPESEGERRDTDIINIHKNVTIFYVSGKKNTVEYAGCESPTVME